MAAELFGVECSFPDCIHDNTKAYRLRVWSRLRERPPEMPIEEWTAHVQGKLLMEFSDRTFQAVEIDFARTAMADLGCTTFTPDVMHMVTDPKVLDPMCDERGVLLQSEPQRRMCLYLRWDPFNGDMLTPDKVLQCVFLPGSTARDRATAPEVRLTEDELNYVFRRGVAHGMVTRVTGIKCQHCHRSVPLRALNTLGTRSCEKGD